MGGFLKKQFKSVKKSIKEDFRRSAEVRKVERQALHEARLESAKTFASKKVDAETKRRLAPKVRFVVSGEKQNSRGGFAALADGLLGPTDLAGSRKKGKKKSINDFI